MCRKRMRMWRTEMEKKTSAHTRGESVFVAAIATAAVHWDACDRQKVNATIYLAQSINQPRSCGLERELCDTLLWNQLLIACEKHTIFVAVVVTGFLVQFLPCLHCATPFHAAQIVKCVFFSHRRLYRHTNVFALFKQFSDSNGMKWKWNHFCCCTATDSLSPEWKIYTCSEFSYDLISIKPNCRAYRSAIRSAIRAKTKLAKWKFMENVIFCMSIRCCCHRS